MPDPTPAEILALPLPENDSGADIVRDHRVALVEVLWRDDVSGKRPFGNSGWRGDFDAAFIRAGWVDGKLDPDEEGWVNEVDRAAVDRLVRSAIVELGRGTAAPREEAP